ncbi:pyridoxal-phosphate-dependent aminotransferase family protein [Salsuginibacillus kocurii]|uniref:pyridoxal-phosphate-dependent aminotransferase family protein n=1 Tax=Salsuginibacillus kocurii TaxID=427078 RepID=UPI0003748B24|nr:alanine--glyoxylate aminotransferase family protein [Salsuginibacillus kocurii]
MKPFIPSQRTIMTPGPVEADPRVLRALSYPIVGQFDPEFTNLMNETMKGTRKLFQSNNHWAYPIDGTSRAGLEAVLSSVIEPGDELLIPIFGRFGYLLTEIAERCGGVVHNIECPWGQVFDPGDVIQAVERVQPTIVAMVHGETSTGCMQPLADIGQFCRKNGQLFIVDAVATIGGVDIPTDDWCIDAIIGGTQKCISGPSGMAPICYNERVEEKINTRKQVEKGIRDAGQDEDDHDRRIQSNYFDLTQLQDYWSPRRLNHHTEATSMLYALYESLRVIQEEGLQNRVYRHQLNEKALVAGLKAMGVSIYNDFAHKLPVVTCIEVPDHVEENSVRQMMLDEFGVEIASSFGPLKGKIWRIGTMGYSCRKENIYHVLFAFEAALVAHGVDIAHGEAVQAAREVFTTEQAEAAGV